MTNIKTIKTIKEALLVIGFFVAAVFIFSILENTAASRILNSFPNYSFYDLKWNIVLLIFGLFGSYWYLGKSIWINFKSKNIIFILILFSIVLCYTSMAMYLTNLDIKKLAFQQYDTIQFPVQEDVVRRNIRVSMATFIAYTTASLFTIGLIILVTGNVQLLLFSRKNSNE